MNTNTHSNKTEQSRLNVLYVIFTLKKYTNEEHPMSILEITNKINQDFLYLTAGDKIISSDTVKRTLEALITILFDPSFESLPNKIPDYGFIIYCVMKTPNGFETYRHNSEGKSPQKYYYYQSTFSNAEVITLIDAVETYNYFSDDDLIELISKLIKLQPLSYASQKYINYNPTMKDNNSILIPNIDLLDQIIGSKKRAKITYCSYNYLKKLIPRNGYPKIIEPLSLMWSNGYYYLVAYHPDYQSIVNYRIDRITEIEAVDQKPTHTLQNFDASRYRLEHPVMYGGKCQEIVFLCRQTKQNQIMNIIMDIFGKPAHIIPATDAELMQYLGHDSSYYQQQCETWYRVSIHSTVGGVELWAAQYCADCLLIKPESSARRLKELFTQALEHYSRAT